MVGDKIEKSAHQYFFWDIPNQQQKLINRKNNDDFLPEQAAPA